MKPWKKYTLLITGSLLLFIIANYGFNTLGWKIPLWLTGIGAFFGFSFLLRGYFMWINREQLSMVLDMATFQMREIKLKQAIRRKRK